MTAGIETDLKLQDSLPYRLSVLSNAVSRGVAERYQRDFNISVWQWRVMAVLGEKPGLSASQIAEHTQMDKVAVSRAVSSLIETGRLRRNAVQDDGRRSHLFLTAEGREIYDRIVPVARAFEADLTQALAPDELEVFLGLLDRLAKQVSPDAALW